MRFTKALIAALCTFALPSSALGAERLIEEIIVTAEHVQKSAQDTPIAITALGNAEIEEFGITDFDDLLVFIPSMSRDLLDITIRGVGRNFRSLGGDVGVPIYINGVYFEEAIAGGSEHAYYDLERIEVLRGPQGTLYGRNAIGGVVNFISNRPTRNFFAEVKGRGGQHERRDFQGVISGPIWQDKLHYRLSGVTVNQGPDRPSRAAIGQRPISDTGDFEDNSISIALDYVPSDNVEIEFRAMHRYQRSVPRSPVFLGEGLGDRSVRSDALCFPEGTDCFNSPGLDFLVFPKLNPAAYSGLPVNGDGYGNRVENWSSPDVKPDYGFRYQTYSLDAKWHFAYDQYTLRLIGGHTDVNWAKWRRQIQSNLGGGAQCQRPLCTPGDGDQIGARRMLSSNPMDQVTAELQLVSNLDGRFNFVGGIFYLDFDRGLDIDFTDTGQLGLLTENPSWGLIDPAQFFDAPRGPGRYNLPPDGEINYFGGNPQGSYFEMDTTTSTRAQAVYWQGYFDLTNELQLTAGLRWSRDEKEGQEWRWAYLEINAEFFGFPSLADFNRELTTDPATGQYNGDAFRLTGFPTELIDNLRIEDAWENLTWRLALTWEPRETMLFYGSATTGYRSGGFNLGLAQEFPYEEEDNLAFELGAKADLFNGRVRANFATYLYRYKNHQVQAASLIPAAQAGCDFGCFDPDGPDVVRLSAVTNVPRAENFGTELELMWAPRDDVVLALMHSYMETEITSDYFVSRSSSFSAFPSDELINLKGSELNRSPRHKYTLWANYRLPLGNNGEINFLTSYSYTDKQRYDVIPDRINEAPSFERWDFRATWDSARGKYRLSAFVKNIENELGLIQIYANENFSRIADTTKPRYWGIEFRMRFGDLTQASGVGQIDGPNPNR